MGEEFYLMDKLFRDRENFPKNFTEVVNEIQRVADSLNKRDELSRRVKERIESPAPNNFPKNIRVRAASFDNYISLIITAPNAFKEFTIKLDEGIG